MNEILGSLELNKVYQFDVLEGLKLLPDNSVESIVTDPPYELGFMGKSWDSSGIAYNVELWKECLRVLKHGGYLLSFGATRTYHRMACAIEDAGFEIRDQIQWIYGSGFPKSQDISRMIDKKNGEIRGKYDEPITKEAEKWRGYGTALKPANEPIVMARKPLDSKTVVDNLKKWGTGAINIDASRIAYGEGGNAATNPSLRKTINGGNGGKVISNEKERRVVIPNDIGRFPSNVILDELNIKNIMLQGIENIDNKSSGIDVSKYFYCPKPSKKERDGNDHPTVKPLKLMEHLVRLVTPEEGVCLDPFAGSGTTLVTCKNIGNNYIGFEINEEYIEIANKRLDSIDLQMGLTKIK